MELTNSPILIFPDPHEPYILFTDVFKHIWSGVFTQECITTMNGKNTKPFYLSHEFLTAHTLNSKVNNWESETASISIEYIKGKDSILSDSISCLIFIQLYHPFDLKGEGKEFEHDIFEEFPP